MTNDRVVKYAALGALVVAALGVPLVSSAQNATKATAAGAAGGWEYRQVFRKRGWSQKQSTVVVMGIPVPKNAFWYDFDDWTTFDGDTKLPAGTDIKVLLNRLGAEGWELVNVTPISSFAGDNSGSNAPVSLAGATTELAYYLKRKR